MIDARLTPWVATWIAASTACIAPYEFVADGSGSSEGGGGAHVSATSTAASSTAAFATSGTSGGGPCPLGTAKAGPYGAAQLYFGVAEVEPVAHDENEEFHASVSPDGSRLVRRWGPGEVAEYVRADLTSGWGDLVHEHYLFYELFPHLSASGLRIFSCHGGELKCVIHARPSLDGDFEIERYFQEIPPFDGAAADFCFTPTPDGEHLAFCSDRRSPEVDEPGGGPRRVWVTRPLDSKIPEAGYGIPVSIPDAGFPGHQDPSWIDDEGLTIAFHSDRGLTRDLFVVSRAAADQELAEPERITALADDSADEAFFSMPSLAVVRQQPCAQSYAYFQRDRALMRVPVCVGAPCE